MGSFACLAGVGLTGLGAAAGLDRSDGVRGGCSRPATVGVRRWRARQPIGAKLIDLLRRERFIGRRVVEAVMSIEHALRPDLLDDEVGIVALLEKGDGLLDEG